LLHGLAHKDQRNGMLSWIEEGSATAYRKVFCHHEWLGPGIKKNSSRSQRFTRLARERRGERFVPKEPPAHEAPPMTLMEYVPIDQADRSDARSRQLCEEHIDTWNRHCPLDLAPLYREATPFACLSLNPSSAPTRWDRGRLPGLAFT
jgi:hypothetical protein